MSESPHREDPLFQTLRHESGLAAAAIANADDLTIVDASRRTFLHVAVANANLAATEALLDREVDVDAQDDDGRTALHYAATQPNLSICELLLKRGASVSVLDRHGNSPLWYAVFTARGAYEVVRLLMQVASVDDVRRKNKAGRSPLDFAQQFGDATLEQTLTSR